MLPRCRLTLNVLAAVLAALLLAVAGAGCGGDEEGGDSAAADKKNEGAEKAFLTAMVSHHESALEMAKIAEQQGKDPFITELAKDIGSTQAREIAEMKDIYTRRFGGPLKPDPGGHDGLGLTAAEAGMTHSADTNVKLRSADPFDRAFVDEMVPHHRGAIKMANVVLKKTDDASLRELAEEIIATQKREIEEMNDFRTKEFGGPVPAGAGHGKPSGHGAPAGEQDHGGEHPG